MQKTWTSFLQLNTSIEITLISAFTQYNMHKCKTSGSIMIDCNTTNIPDWISSVNVMQMKDIQS